jgi:hypothetical protein
MNGPTTGLMPFAGNYETRAADRSAFGEEYTAPDVMEHGVWTEVFRTKCDENGDIIRIFEMRMPARFYRLEVSAADGSLKLALSTGSGTEQGAFLRTMADMLREGMLAVDQRTALGYVTPSPFGSEERLESDPDGLLTRGIYLNLDHGSYAWFASYDDARNWASIQGEDQYPTRVEFVTPHDVVAEAELYLEEVQAKLGEAPIVWKAYVSATPYGSEGDR